MTSMAIKCPYCSKPDMVPDRELGGPWLKCSSCGTTHNRKQTQTGASALGGKWSKGDTSHYHPGGVS